MAAVDTFDSDRDLEEFLAFTLSVTVTLPGVRGSEREILVGYR
jgi:hypothetical protein